MKKYLILLLTFFALGSCQQDDTIIEATANKKLPKVDVCHKGEIISINENALKAHLGHGDAVDMDGDGFFDRENDCSDIDCDDTDPNIHRYTLYGTYFIYRANGAVLNITIDADGNITGEGYTSAGPTDLQTYTGTLTVYDDQTILMTIPQFDSPSGTPRGIHYIGGFINKCGGIVEDLSDERTDGRTPIDYSFTDFE